MALLTNTVPYKPPGNKAYAECGQGAVPARSSPSCWRSTGGGDRVLTLGTEAFQWFAPYAEPGAADAFWAREDRYEADLPCVLTAEVGGKASESR